SRPLYHGHEAAGRPSDWLRISKESRMFQRWLGAALGLVPIAFGPSIEGQTQERKEAETARPEAVEGLTRVGFERIVADGRGRAADGAVVVSSAGGRTVTDAGGSYRLEVQLPTDAESVQITAIGGHGGSLVASTSVQLAAGTALVRVGPLALAQGSTCQPSW